MFVRISQEIPCFKMQRLTHHMANSSRASSIMTTSTPIASSGLIHPPLRPHRKTAGIVIIGDEILRGQTLDTNSNVLCRALYKLSIPVQRVVVIPDSVDEIAAEIKSFSARYDYVLTTGGIGPTHDDVTYDGISRAFNVPLIRHPSLVQLIDNFLEVNDVKPDHPAYKMSTVPENARILFASDRVNNRFPLVSVENVFVLPGIPYYLERCLPILVEHLMPDSSEPPVFRSIFLGIDEVLVAPVINSAVDRFHKSVSFGSYPSVSNNYYKVQITMESTVDGIVEAESHLRVSLPNGAVVNYDSDSIPNAEGLLYDRLANDPHDVEWLSNSVHLLEDCLRDRYKPSEICISFNGGKDCTALLHLYHAVSQRHLRSTNDGIKKGEGRIVAFYVECSNPFSEVDQFIRETVIRYNLDLFKVPGPIKSGLEQLLAARPNIQAILMGNRRTDPHSGNLKSFQETDRGWPSVMRVFPLLDWNYKNVWQFLRQFYVPYCMLYDQGYTSLGSRHNTAPNPNLKYSRDGQDAYYPAYTMDDQKKERNGRR